MPEKINSPENNPACGLCGKTTELTQTACCNQWICTNMDQETPFSDSPENCHQKHQQHTLCAYHQNERHSGDWKTCKKCREDFKTELYVYYGTNEYNFEALENPPAYAPTHCSTCRKEINLKKDAYLIQQDSYLCIECCNISLADSQEHSF